MAIETSATQQSRRPRHNPENNNAIDNGRENLHSIIVIIEITTSTNNTSLQILTLKKYSSRKVLFFINLHMLNTKFIIYT
jgi:hypothetical protein